MLAVEFIRQSKDGRLTLIIDPKGKKVAKVRSLWAIMDTLDLDFAVKKLQEREGTSRCNIHQWSSPEPDPVDIEGLSVWANARGVGAVIWTGLGAKFDSDDGRVPSVGEAVKYLASLEGREREAVEEYIRKAPAQIDTVFRRRFESEFGWTPIT